MSDADLQQSMTDEDRAAFDHGAKLLGELQEGKGFDDYWARIGEGLLAIYRTVEAAIETGKLRQNDYNIAFGRMCKGTPYDEQRFKKASRSNLLFCMKHLADIAEMRAKWTPDERTKIAHPDTMVKRLRNYIQHRDNPKPIDSPKPNVSRAALLLEENEALRQQVARLEDDGGNLWRATDTAADIAKFLTDHLARLSESKADNVLKLMREYLKDRWEIAKHSKPPKLRHPDKLPRHVLETLGPRSKARTQKYPDADAKLLEWEDDMIAGPDGNHHPIARGTLARDDWQRHGEVIVEAAFNAGHQHIGFRVRHDHGGGRIEPIGKAVYATMEAAKAAAERHVKRTGP